MKQRRLRFRLATLLLVVALSAAAIEVIASRVRRDAEIDAAIKQMEQALIDYKNKYGYATPCRGPIPYFDYAAP